MSSIDWLKFTPFVSITLGIIALIVTVRVASIRRDLWRTKLRTSIGFSGHSSWKPEIPWKLRRKPVSTLFVFLSGPQRGNFEVPLIFQVHNKSFKSIKDVMIELTYPERFLVTNADFKQSLDRSFQIMRREKIPAKDIEVNYPALDKFLEMRDASLFGDMATVRYHFPLLRPSEGYGLWDPIRIEVPPDKQRNSGFEGAAYGRIAERIRQIDGVVDHCIVTYRAFADNYAAKPKRISVCIVTQYSRERLEKIAEEYGLAHWFGQPPRPGIYHVPPFPVSLLFGRRKDSIELAEVIDLRTERVFGKVKTKGNKSTLTVATRLQPLNSPVCYVTMNLKTGYDYFALPDHVSTAEEAFAHIGAKFVLPTTKEVQGYITKEAKRASTKLRTLVKVTKNKLAGIGATVRRKLGMGDTSGNHD